MDHTTERVEKVAEDLSRQLGEVVRGWMAKIQEAESVTLDETERGVREGMQPLGRAPCTLAPARRALVRTDRSTRSVALPSAQHAVGVSIQGGPAAGYRAECRDLADARTSWGVARRRVAPLARRAARARRHR
jgi:hypothetical protein